MDTEDLSRRSLLQAIAATIGAAALPLGWAEIAQASHEAHAAAQPAGEARLSFLSAAEAADVEAVAAQIIPTDDTPGAREAGVVYFIDRALAIVLLAARHRLPRAAHGLQVTFRERHPGAASFAALPSGEQVEYLKTVDRHAVLRHDAAADDPRHVFHAEVRRESKWRGLEDDWVRRPACLSAAVRLLRPRLSWLRQRSGERPMSAQVSGLRDGRLRRRRFRRGGWSHRAAIGAGRAHGGAAGTGAEALACGASSTMS